MNVTIHKTFPIAWYAVAWAEEVQSKPVRKEILKRRFVLYRDSNGTIQCLSAYCPHRGVDLSLGWVKQDCLVCPYHGWEFDKIGRCVSIPSQPDKPIPSFAHTKSYPVMERAGIVWVYPSYVAGNDTLPELPLFEELESEKFTLSSYDAVWNAHLTRVVESVLDVAHLPFVHKNTIGKRLKEEINGLDFQVEGDSILIANGDGLLEYRFPNLWILRPRQQQKRTFINFVTFTPLEEEKTMIYGYAGRTFAKNTPFLHRIFSAYSAKILREDKEIVESQHPRPIPEALRMEAHVQADGPQVRFRQRWLSFLENDEPKITI